MRNIERAHTQRRHWDSTGGTIWAGFLLLDTTGGPTRNTAIGACEWGPIGGAPWVGPDGLDIDERAHAELNNGTWRKGPFG